MADHSVTPPRILTDMTLIKSYLSIDMSYVPGQGGSANVSSTTGSGIVVSGGSVLSSGLVAGSNITLTATSDYGGRGLRIDSSGGGGGGLASVTSSNGSGVNVTQVGANANLTSALVAGTGIALTASPTTKNITIANTQTVQSTGNGSGISTSTDVNGNTKVQTNLTAGSNIALTPSSLNTSIGIGLKPNVVIPVNGSLAVNEAAINSTASAMEVADAPTGYFYVRNGTSGTPGQIGYYNQAAGYDNYYITKQGNIGCATVSANTAFILNGAVVQNPQDGMELYDGPNSYLYFNKSNGYLGHFIQNGGPDWSMTPTGGLSCDTVNATTSMTTQGQLTVRNIVNSVPPVGFGDILSLTDSANSYYIQYNDGGSLGGWNTSPNIPIWSINKTGAISTSGSLTSASATVSGQVTTGSLNFPLGQITLSSGAGTNRIQAATPVGQQSLAYLSDINTTVPSLQVVCQQGGNAVSEPGIQFLPPTATSGVFLKCFNTNELTVQPTSGSVPSTITMNNGGTVSLGTLNFQGGALNLSSAIGSNRISVAGSGPTQTLAYLSDITGGGGGVQSVTAGSTNIVIGGTTTNPTVNLASNPTISGRMTAAAYNSTSASSNNFAGGVYAPAFVAATSGNLGVSMGNPSSSVLRLISNDGVTPCQLRINGTSQLISGSSTATLSTTNNNLQVNNVPVLTTATGINFTNIVLQAVAPGSVTLTAANFGQTLLYDFTTSGTFVVALPNIPPGTVPLGSFINIGYQVSDSTPSTTLTVQPYFGNSINVSATNRILTFILTGYSANVPWYHCLGS